MKYSCAMIPTGTQQTKPSMNPLTSDRGSLDVESPEKDEEIQTTKNEPDRRSSSQLSPPHDNDTSSSNPEHKSASQQPANEDDEIILNNEQDEIFRKCSSRKRLWEILKICACKNAFPDDLTHFRGFQVIESIETVRILKFLVVTTILMMTNYAIVRGLEWENDEYYSLVDFFVFDFVNVMVYSVVFAVVGRIGKKKGVDRLVFIVPTMFASIATSASTNISFLRSDITMYSISCVWQWQMFLFAVIICFAIGTTTFLHIRNSIRDSSHVKRLVEILLLVIFFILPHVFYPHFHLHHYYSFWLVGMVCNRDEWWSQLAMSICWGQFINGISVYGQDPIQTCADALHTSISNGCLLVTVDSQGVIDGAIDEYGGGWIEMLLGAGKASACFIVAAAEAPDPKNCTS